MHYKHHIFYTAYHYLRDCNVLELTFNYSEPDDLDQLLWAALGYKDPFILRNTCLLTDHDLARLRLICAPHGLTIFKAMLARKDLIIP